MAQEPTFYRYLNGEALPETEIWTKMLRHLGLWPLLGYGYWAVEERATGAFVGAVGFADWQRDLTPSLKGFPEAGWVLAPHIHGRGYGREAVQAMLAWGDVQLPQRRTVCLIDPANAASLGLAAASGYREFARAPFKEAETVLLERFAS